MYINAIHKSYIITINFLIYNILSYIYYENYSNSHHKITFNNKIVSCRENLSYVLL